MAEFKYEIVKHIGVLSESSRGKVSRAHRVRKLLAHRARQWKN